MSNPLSEAVEDIVGGIKLAPLWSTLGWDQTVSRFRRTILGPFWLSANMFAIALAFSLVFGGLLGTDWRVTFALILSGVLTWSIVGGPLSECAGLFPTSSSMMMTHKLPLTFYVCLTMYRVCINFAAQLIALWVVLLILRMGSVPSWHLIFGLPIVICTVSLMGLVIAFPAARYRDVQQLIGAALQVLFFITPIVWAPINMSRRQRLLAHYNPLAHLVALVREPLLGRAPHPADWSWSIGTLFVSFALAVIVLAAYRKRVIFWL